MDAIQIEHVFYLFLAKSLKFTSCYLIKVNKRYMFFFSHLLGPQTKSFIYTSNYSAVFIFPSIARGKRKKNGMSSFGFDFTNVTTHVFAVCIHCFLYPCFLNCYFETVFADTWNRSTCPSAVIRSVIVMPQFDNNPVAFFYPFQDVFPQMGIECTATGSSQRMIFYCNLVFIKIFMEEISPSPLSVISIT